MNMEKVIHFKTMIGYCNLYPDKIIMARKGNPEEINLKNEEERLWKHLVLYPSRIVTRVAGLRC